MFSVLPHFSTGLLTLQQRRSTIWLLQPQGQVQQASRVQVLCQGRVPASEMQTVPSAHPRDIPEAAARPRTEYPQRR